MLDAPFAGAASLSFQYGGVMNKANEHSRCISYLCAEDSELRVFIDTMFSGSRLHV